LEKGKRTSSEKGYFNLEVSEAEDVGACDKTDADIRTRPNAGNKRLI
jgi:hypothetical protein